MVLPQLPVELGLLIVTVELVLSVPVSPSDPHPLYYGIAAFETYGKLIHQTSWRPSNLTLPLTET